MQLNNDKSLEELTVPNDRWLTPRIGLLLILIIAVCTAVLITHWSALSAKALSFDDNRYFVENFLVRSPSVDSAWRFLTEVFNPSTVGGYYQPLTMISLMLDYAIGGQTDNIMTFHRTSLLFHVLNTALIIVLLYQLFGSEWIAAGVGLLFGVHPLTVETIPWIGERKTLLAAFFAFWSLILYVRFARSGNPKTRIGSIVMYALALMSKPTSTPLPVLMLLMDYWPLRRLTLKTIIEKWPFFVVGGISAVITYISQSRTASVILPESYGIMRVPMVICHNIIFYLYKMIWPLNLSSHYVFPDPLGFSTPMVMIGVIGTLILIPLLLVSLRWTRAAIIGWLIFFVMVFPTMQMLQFSDVIASDKFVYLPSIGILMIVAAFLSWICRVNDVHRHMVRYAITAIVVLMLAGAESFATRQYLADWKDTASLFKHMTKVTPNAVSPYLNMGVALGKAGDIKGATECFEKVLKIKPDDIDAHTNLGKIYADQGKDDEAMVYYNKALQVDPNQASTYVHLGVMLTKQGHIDEAIALYRKAIERKMKYSSPLHVGLGTLLLEQGKIEEAIYEFDYAVKLKPDATTFNNLGVALGLKGRTDEAMENHKKAIRLDPNNAEAHYNLGNILLSQRKNKEAIKEYQNAIRINPKYTKAQINLAVALTRENRINEAIMHATEAVKLEPNSFEAHYNLALALDKQDRTDEAIEHFAKAAKINPNDAEAHYNLAMDLMQQDRVDEAVENFSEAAEIEPNNVNVRRDLAIGLWKKGWLDEAANEFRYVLKLQPQDANTHSHLGNILAAQSHFDEAAAEYSQALKINPEHSEAKEGLKSILSLKDANQTTK
jgi:protein O-mannosyl-transferase